MEMGVRREIRSKTGSLAGTSDLTVVAPILPGLVSALDTVTYKTRVKRVLRTLHLGRAASHEQDLVRLMSDAVERVGRIHSVRIAVIEPQDVVLLAVTFDGAWESYVRTIWQKVARLLDLIFCNTVDYTMGGTSSFEAWGVWLRSRQVETPFLYATPGLSCEDSVFHRMRHRAALRDGDAVAGEAALRTPVPLAEEIAESMIRDGIDPTRLGSAEALGPFDNNPPSFRQGLRALIGLHRLTDLYPPGTPDGDVLMRAAIELLPEFRRQMDVDVVGIKRARERYGEAIDWYRNAVRTMPPTRHRRPPPDVPPLDGEHGIQAGILEPLPDCRHGVMVLLAFTSADGMRRFLERARDAVTVRNTALPADGISVNLALTVEGLRRAGLPEDEILRLPEEFVQGMAARAGLLGDLRLNHPRRWRLPPLNWTEGIDAPDRAEHEDVARLELETVHALLQLRLCDMPADETERQSRRRLLTRAEALIGSDGGTAPLSLQWLRRLRDPQAQPPDQVVEHFGFGDGASDPVLRKDQAGRQFANHVHVGEALLGHGNAADEAPVGGVGPLLHNGSFLVVRKLRQDLGVLEQVLARTTEASGLDRDTVLAKMMGRWPARHPLANRPLVPLADPTRLNDFNYRPDPAGLACPFYAHIRRAHPRSETTGALAEALDAGARPPYLFRRSLSYGEPLDRDQPDPQRHADSLAQERGLVFMAYNASIGEQFETVQRWLVGASAAGGASTPSDPFFGVAEGGHERCYVFHDAAGRTVRMRLDGDVHPHAEPRPLVRLEWGLYAFAPSTLAIEALAQRIAGHASAASTQAPAAPSASPLPWDTARGRVLIAQLKALEASSPADVARSAWKAALEDAESLADFSAASIWAAIRQDHGGVLRTAYGVLVGAPALVEAELTDTARATSVAGYRPRMRNAFGEIFLGHDAGAVYDAESAAGLEAVAAMDAQAAYHVARQTVLDRLRAIVERSREMTREDETMRRSGGLEPRTSLRWETTIDVRELVDDLLAVFCEQWFGLSEDGGHFVRGGPSWNWKPGDPPRYPGHYLSPSRWFFQPHPGPAVEATGAAHGQALRKAMEAYLGAFGAALHQPPAAAVLRSAAAAADHGYAARTMNGLIMGFVPTIDGVLRRVLTQWSVDGTLASLRALRAVATTHQLDSEIESAFARAMQLRTTPELIWRTAVAEHQVGHERVQPGETIVLGLASSTQASLGDNRVALAHAFGGNRGAASPPRHACPAMAQALQLMRGFVAALVESELPLRAGPAPGLLAAGAWLEHPVAEEEPAAPAHEVAEAKRQRRAVFAQRSGADR